jgi:hypothetical protein
MFAKRRLLAKAFNKEKSVSLGAKNQAKQSNFQRSA